MRFGPRNALSLLCLLDDAVIVVQLLIRRQQPVMLYLYAYHDVPLTLFAYSIDEQHVVAYIA